MTLGTVGLLGAKADLTPGTNTTVITVGSVDAHSAAGSGIVVGPSAAGESLWLAINVNNTAANTTVSTIVDTAGNTWNLVSGATDTNDTTGEPTYFYEVDNGGALANGNTITITWSGALATGGSRNAIAGHAPGLLNPATDTAAAAASHASTAAPTATTATLHQAAELIIATCCNQSAGGLAVWPAGWTVLGTASASQVLSMAYKVVAATTAVTAAPTLTSAVHATIGVMPLEIDTSTAPKVILYDQAIVSPAASAVVIIFDQSINTAGGSLATVQIYDQSASYATTVPVNVPTWARQSSGDGKWLPYTIFSSNGSGEWI